MGNDDAGQHFWVNTISREHVLLGVEGGFTQADHGKPTRLAKLAAGDGILFYSPRTAMRAGEALQEFTAWGLLTADPIYQVEMSPDFRPWRRRVDFREAAAVPIRPMLGELSFIAGAPSWGMVFRRGLFEIPETDFELITGRMTPAGAAD
ncbi:EVE domain-containing protein [Knoellia sp. CPCC 206453]|uniref:EVE domain-containing protein n=1 Tax=Knoellia pratensis TaxID=3404796 RepID=UPI003606805A